MSGRRGSERRSGGPPHQKTKREVLRDWALGFSGRERPERYGSIKRKKHILQKAGTAAIWQSCWVSSREVVFSLIWIICWRQEGDEVQVAMKQKLGIGRPELAHACAWILLRHLLWPGLLLAVAKPRLRPRSHSPPCQSCLGEEGCGLLRALARVGP